MSSDLTIIENTYDARADYGFYYGCSELVITKEHMLALLDR